MNQRLPGAAAPDYFSENFGAFLLSEKAIDEPALQRSLRAARQSGERFDHVLSKLGLSPESDLCAYLGKFLGLAIFNPGDAPEKPLNVPGAPQQFLGANGIIPLELKDGVLHVAITDPFDEQSCQALSYAIKMSVDRRLSTHTLFEKTWNALYSNPLDLIGTPDADQRVHQANETDLQRLRDIANEAPVVRQVNQIIANAVEAGASDIHVEPTAEELQIRYRVDGELRMVPPLPHGLRDAISSRIKIMARLDIAERRIPQDGRIKLPIRGVDIDFRVSTIPTIHGESIVLRILDRTRAALDFKELGFEPEAIATLRRVMELPNGIVLVTGPTGSGKTTTLYTALHEMARPNAKVFTVEDPVEYQLSGINQVQVQPSIGLDFPTALRAILRQDPNIIMIGEIRDAETAKIAIQASLTGHLVFSTLHTNSAASSITRLIDIGVEGYLIASTVKAVLAQRLVRRICPHCATPHDSRDQWRETLLREIMPPEPENILQPKGCPHCHGLGYSGRTTIAELLIVNDNIQRLIHQSAADDQIEEAARHSGMITLRQCGMTKAWRGETSTDEVLRVTRAE